MLKSIARPPKACYNKLKQAFLMRFIMYLTRHINTALKNLIGASLSD
ncbi:hypothetical protein EJK54_0463 [Moraxella catarrhalis]|uniref:Uncharacterized protein n=1 Tax=Moraxella catarrhalis TaxID=480 RepID=A0A3Q9GHD8_MORCA|nr:hypothetical protein EJK53_0010 [Moraxella catarrhalis]AZQ94773.1 hypothetical protein EJK48_0010 [Moraxella catarrhalis]RUO14084.1 hypothetical protein EJK49_1209 [Moraxella catarrhalis]RUO16674.1 hypothetical protein EJK54_0463 [Moraxella catarrhalis]